MPHTLTLIESGLKKCFSWECLWTKLKDKITIHGGKVQKEMALLSRFPLIRTSKS